MHGFWWGVVVGAGATLIVVGAGYLVFMAELFAKGDE